MQFLKKLFNREDAAGACGAYEAALADHLEAGPRSRPSAALAAHLESCAACSEALALAREGGALVRDHAIAVPPSLADDPYFATRVSARIREHGRHSGDFLPQLETASLRLMAYALSLAVLLGALTASGVTRSSQTVAGRRASGVRTASFDANPAPVNPDDVILAVLTTQGGQR